MVLPFVVMMLLGCAVAAAATVPLQYGISMAAVLIENRTITTVSLLY